MEHINKIFALIALIDENLWHIGFAFLCLSGLYLTIKSRFFQFRVLAKPKENISAFFKAENKGSAGINPIKLYFTSVGGMVGLGNIAGISIAVMVGGPGSIFWMWTVVIFGTLIKYSEIYLGVKHRVKNNQGSFDGGPMYYIQDAFKINGKLFAFISSFFLCIYGIEIFQFVTLVDKISITTEIERNYIIVILLIVIFYSVFGGLRRISNICSVIMPFFMIFYIFACLYIILLNYHLLPEMLVTIIKSAFTGHAAIGGFAGSTMLQAAYMGASKAVYSGDIGIGYDSVVQSETKIIDPAKQAKLSIFSLCTDTFICTMTTLTVTVTGAWYKMAGSQPSELISTILSKYFPYSDYIVALLYFFAGFTTIIGYFAVGSKAADFISKKYGKIIYYIYAFFAFIFFSNFSQENAAIIMSITSLFLIVINITAILKMRNEIKF